MFARNVFRHIDHVERVAEDRCQDGYLVCAGEQCGGGEGVEVSGVVGCHQSRRGDRGDVTRIDDALAAGTGEIRHGLAGSDDICPAQRVGGKARRTQDRPFETAFSGRLRCRQMPGADAAEFRRRCRWRTVRRPAGRRHGEPCGPARDLAVSERQLRNLFATGIGISPKHFARIGRIRRILVDVSDTDVSLAHVAAVNGYYDQSPLSADFKALIGVPPAKFLQGRLPAPLLCRSF